MDQIDFSRFCSKIDKLSKVSECVFPIKTNCSRKIIKAHSIQRGRILTKIAENGMILQIDAREALFKPIISEVGIASATTFSGFCSKHDQEIFQKIDTENYNPGDIYQEFLFSYRTLAREYVKKKQARNGIKQVVDLEGETQFLIDCLQGTQEGLERLEQLKDQLNNAILANDYKFIKSRCRILDKEYCIAVSSVFFLRYDFESNQIQSLEDVLKLSPIFLTIFPQDGKTFILFSYFQKDSEKFRPFLNQLWQFDNEIFTSKLSLLIALYCENFAYSPRLLQKWTELQKINFLQIFLLTIYSSNWQELLKQYPFFDFFIQ